MIHAYSAPSGRLSQMVRFMTLDAFVKFFPLLALLTWAAVEDLRAWRIPNWINFTLALGGLALSPTPLRPDLTFWQSLAGLLTGLALPLAFYALGALGAGDVKLLAAIGAWVGVSQILIILALTAIVGGIVILLQGLWQRRLGAILRNSALIAINLIHIGRLGADHVRQTGQSCRSIEKTVPYAVPIWIATVLTLFTPVLSLLTGRLG
jgi:prepilin peptidase CpaA